MNSRLLISALILAQTGIIKSSEKDILHEICKQREDEETRARAQLAEITEKRAAQDAELAALKATTTQSQAALEALEAEERATRKAQAKADDFSRRSVMTPEELAAFRAKCDAYNARQPQAAAAPAALPADWMQDEEPELLEMASRLYKLDYEPLDIERIHEDCPELLEDDALALLRIAALQRVTQLENLQLMSTSMQTHREEHKPNPATIARLLKMYPEPMLEAFFTPGPIMQRMLTEAKAALQAAEAAEAQYKETLAPAAAAPATLVDPYGAVVDALSLDDLPTPDAEAVLATRKSLEDERSRRSKHEILIATRQYVLERLKRKDDDDVQTGLEKGGPAYAVTARYKTPRDLLAAITTEDKPGATTASGINDELTADQAAFSQGNQTLLAVVTTGHPLAAMEFKPAKTDMPQWIKK